MSSSVCHAPLPPSMGTFTTKIYLQAVDQYEKLIQAHFSKDGGKKIVSYLEFSFLLARFRENYLICMADWRISEPLETQLCQSRVEEQNDICLRNGTRGLINRNATGKAHSAVGASRQWRKSEGSSSNDVEPSNQFTNPNIGGIGMFPLILSDTATTEDLSLKFLAFNALDLTAPASDVLLKSRRDSWFQLSGHPDGFTPAGPGTVWKRRTGGCENTERRVYEELSNDVTIKEFIPQYYREVVYKGDTFIELQDLLFGFNNPRVMDIKLGTRTFSESEVSKTVAREDLYKKMIAVDPNSPTAMEHRCEAVTKLRYMQFREQQSSTCSHGFRIEAMKLPGSPPITQFQTVKFHEEVVNTMSYFLGKKKETSKIFFDRLKKLRSRIEESTYFQTHEVIGSSIFVIFDSERVGVWLIDFAKTYRVPDGKRLTHRATWEQGNHEEGFLFGLDNLISTVEEVLAKI